MKHPIWAKDKEGKFHRIPYEQMELRDGKYYAGRIGFWHPDLMGFFCKFHPDYFEVAPDTENWVFLPEGKTIFNSHKRRMDAALSVFYGAAVMTLLISLFEIIRSYL